jgi:hypothetical protein
VNLTESFSRALPASILDRYELRETRNAAAVLRAAHPDALSEVVEVLDRFELSDDDVLAAGGSKSDVARRLDESFRILGWREGRIDTRLVLEARLMPYRLVGEKHAVVTSNEVFNEGYKVDNLKAGVALDVEWNAKDGNLDRDLAAYRSLYDAAVIDAAVIVTRTSQDLRAFALKLDPGTTKFATSTTTNLEKLVPRLTRGDGGGCPVLAIAISSKCHKP